MTEASYVALLADDTLWRVKLVRYADGWNVFWCASGDDMFAGDCHPYCDMQTAISQIADDARVYRESELVALYEAKP